MCMSRPGKDDCPVVLRTRDGRQRFGTIFRLEWVVISCRSSQVHPGSNWICCNCKVYRPFGPWPVLSSKFPPMAFQLTDASYPGCWRRLSGEWRRISTARSQLWNLLAFDLWCRGAYSSIFGVDHWWGTACRGRMNNQYKFSEVLFWIRVRIWCLGRCNWLTRRSIPEGNWVLCFRLQVRRSQSAHLRADFRCLYFYCRKVSEFSCKNCLWVKKNLN